MVWINNILPQQTLICTKELLKLRQIYLQTPHTQTSPLLAHPGWELDAWCPSATLWPLPHHPDIVRLLSRDQAWGQTFWQVKGHRMGWWCHRGCWWVARKAEGLGCLEGCSDNTAFTVLRSLPVGTQQGTELPLMALNRAWWLALI